MLSSMDQPPSESPLWLTERHFPSHIPSPSTQTLTVMTKSSNGFQFSNKLRQMVNSVQTYDDSNICEEFLKNNVNDNKIIF
ncbi:unnamed protein product [Rotaria sp. Silwood2]|nr:unnamed protein product [Rotaria sp. Silwood2]